MDFSFTPEQDAVRQAATALFDGLVTPDRVAETEATDERVDRPLWAALAAADLLGLAVPEALGGQGLGLTELCLVLEAQGACVAPVPLYPTLVLGGLALSAAGGPAAGAWLPEVAAGRAMLTGALNGAATSTAGLPAVIATADGARWRLEGTELAVPQAHVAHRVVVPARVAGGGVLLALVDPSGDGVALERAETTNREVHPHLHLHGAVVGPDDLVAGPDSGADALEALVLSATTALCALAVGVAESALRQTAAYLNGREQFGRPLSTFQGTLLKAGDAAIDTEAMRVTLWQAAWQLDTGRDARVAVAAAKWQAAERGQRVVHATQHLHGGMGADITYPIHRYFLWGKQLELMLGGPSVQLATLGRLVAERARAEVA
jgi:alkylation response protein AidB-like acyl-CoA dehydrogenase